MGGEHVMRNLEKLRRRGDAVTRKRGAPICVTPPLYRGYAVVTHTKARCVTSVGQRAMSSNQMRQVSRARNGVPEIGRFLFEGYLIRLDGGLTKPVPGEGCSCSGRPSVRAIAHASCAHWWGS